MTGRRNTVPTSKKACVDGEDAKACVDGEDAASKG